MNLQILVDKEKTILSKNNLLALWGGGVETRGEFSNETNNGVNFLLCSSCFWCASFLSPDSSPAKCPSCIEGNIESIPIAENEEYRFNNDIKRGITMEFLRWV
jgi:hypothetical protein